MGKALLVCVRGEETVGLIAVHSPQKMQMHLWHKVALHFWALTMQQLHSCSKALHALCASLLF